MSATPSTHAVDRRPVGGAHLVTFHEDDAALVVAIVDHVSAGLRGGHAALVIAGSHRWDDISEALRRADVDVTRVRASGQLQLIDAADLLARISHDGRPDPGLFHEIIGELVREAAETYGDVDAFGEMVALLYGDGNVVAALRLEQMWNRLHAQHGFDLLCGYPTSMVDGDEDTDAFHAICETHNGVTPASATASAATTRLARDAAVVQARVENPRHDDRLTEQVDVLPDVDRVRRRFTAMVVHDIRSPNAIVEGSLQLLLEAWQELDPADVEELLRRSLGQTRRVARLADDILTMSKLESGEFTYELSELALGDLIRQAVAELQRSRGWDIELDVPDDLPRVVADEGRQVQILENLLSNAEKFGGGSATRVVVRAGGRSVEVRIVDDGQGLTTEEVGQLFRPFSRPVRARRVKGAGTGLGLYIARALVEGQGGSLVVHSRPGEGSTFAYTVPVAPRA